MSRKPEEFANHPVSFGDAQSAGLVRGFCKRVTDGDTFDVFLDLGFLNFAYWILRLHDVDTPEIFRPRNEEEKKHGYEAKARVVELMLDKPVLVKSFKDRQTFGRFVADVFVAVPEDMSPLKDYVFDGQVWKSLGTILQTEGLAKDPDRYV